MNNDWIVKDIEDYLASIFLSKRIDGESEIHFIEDENGNSLGRELFNGMMSQLAGGFTSIDSFTIKNRGKVFIIHLPEPLNRKELERKFKNKQVVINHEFYEVIGIETPAVNKSFSLVGLLTKYKDDENK